MLMKNVNIEIIQKYRQVNLKFRTSLKLRTMYAIFRVLYSVSKVDYKSNKLDISGDIHVTACDNNSQKNSLQNDQQC